MTNIAILLTWVHILHVHDRIHAVYKQIFSPFSNLHHSSLANCAATEELPSILWKPKVHYRVHKSPQLVPILSQINPIHTIPLRSILLLSTHLRLRLPSRLLPHQYPICIPLLHHSCYMPYPFHPPRIYISKHNIFVPSEEKNKFLRGCEFEKELHQISVISTPVWHSGGPTFVIQARDGLHPQNVDTAPSFSALVIHRYIKW
jgi:hypothetical protein